MSFVIQARRESFGWYIRKLHLLRGSKIVSQQVLTDNMSELRILTFFFQKSCQNDLPC